MFKERYLNVVQHVKSHIYENSGVIMLMSCST
jgi:hypothetical protein